MAIPKRVTDVWEVRCWYNNSDIPSRIQQGQLDRKLVRRYQPKNGPAKGGGWTEIFGWYDPITNQQVAETCNYLLPDGSMGGSGELDPKKVLVNGILIVAYEGKDRIARDPGNLFPNWGHGLMPKLYGRYRKRCCRKFGPEGDANLAARQTPRLRKLFFFWDSGRS